MKFFLIVCLILRRSNSWKAQCTSFRAGLHRLWRTYQEAPPLRPPKNQGGRRRVPTICFLQQKTQKSRIMCKKKPDFLHTFAHFHTFYRLTLISVCITHNILFSGWVMTLALSEAARYPKEKDLACWGDVRRLALKSLSSLLNAVKANASQLAGP